ncbi:MAG: hypothetical protein HC905_02955 [Bacteroidales bacterium]|nr:hypothetical protein [Bacteroidales bacterium]
MMEKSGNFQNTRGELLKINAADLLQKNNLKSITQHSGEIILVTDDIIKSSRIWIILSQMGIQNVYILTDNLEENLKYEFRPDSSVRPEF